MADQYHIQIKNDTDQNTMMDLPVKVVTRDTEGEEKLKRQSF